MMPPGFPPFMPPMMGMPPPGMFPPGFPPFAPFPPFGMMPGAMPGMPATKFKSIDDKMKEYKNHYDDVRLFCCLND